MNKQQKQEYIAALLSERAGYVRYGNEAGVQDIDAELARLGHDAKPPAKRAETMDRKGASKSPARTET